MENSLLFNFDEIWPKTLYYNTWSLTRFLSNFKNSENVQIDRNQLKLDKQNKTMYQKI